METAAAASRASRGQGAGSTQLLRQAQGGREIDDAQSPEQQLGWAGVNGRVSVADPAPENAWERPGPTGGRRRRRDAALSRARPGPDARL